MHLQNSKAFATATLADMDRGFQPLKSRRSFDRTLNFDIETFPNLKVLDKATAL
jgi:hypothetical protein